MLPAIILGGITATAVLIEVLSDSDKDKSSYEFDEKFVISKHLKTFKYKDQSKAKHHVTGTINKLISGGTRQFKIGKTGSPKERFLKYPKFSNMYLLVTSKDSQFIDNLEAFYNQKYITNPKNKNDKAGSAGAMTDKFGRYYLYIMKK